MELRRLLMLFFTYCLIQVCQRCTCETDWRADSILGPDATDVDTITALQGMTNVIPLLARADELSSEEVTASKDKVEEALGDSHANCFSFASPESVGESTHV